MTSHPPPSPNWANGSHARSGGSPGALVMMVVGAIIFAAGCGSGLVAGWFAGAAAGFGALLDDFAVSDTGAKVIPPSTPVLVGEPFPLILHLTETSGEPRTIYSIDLWTDQPDTLTFQDSTPAPDERGEVAPAYTELFYDITLGPNESKDITFTLEALTPGAHAGAFEVYFDETLSQTVRFAVDVASPE